MLMLSVLVLGLWGCTASSRSQADAGAVPESGRQEQELEPWVQRARDTINVDEKVYFYRKVLAVSPEHPPALAGLGRAYLSQTYRSSDIDPVNRKALREEAFRLIGEAVRRVPTSSEYRFHQAEAFRARGESEQALVTLNKAIELDPLNIRAYLAKIYLLESNGQLEKGLATCDYALLIDPESAALHRARASLLWTLNRPEEALAVLDRAIDRAPDSAVGYRQRARYLERQGKRQEALADLSMAIELAPNNHRLYEQRSALYFAAGQRDLAEADQARADDVNLEALYSKALLLRDQDQALAAADRAIRFNPWRAAGFLARGRLLLKRGEPERARDDLARALELKPSEHAYLYQAVALGQLNQAEAAVASLKQACETFGECGAYEKAVASVSPLTGTVVEIASGAPVPDALVVLTRTSHHHDPWNGNTDPRLHGREYAISEPDGSFTLPPISAEPMLPSLEGRETLTFIEYALHPDFRFVKAEYSGDGRGVTVLVRPGDGISSGAYDTLFERPHKLQVRKKDRRGLGRIMSGWTDLARNEDFRRRLEEFGGRMRE